MLFHFVGKNALNWVGIKFLAYLGDSFCDLSIGSHLLNFSLSSQERVVCSEDYISFPSWDLWVSICTNHDSMGALSDKAINVTSKIYFSDITFFEIGRLVTHWGIVTHNIVYWYASRESDSSFKFLCLFVAKHFLQFLFHEDIRILAHLINVCSNFAFSKNLLECSITDLSSCFIFIKNSWLVDETFILEFFFTWCSFSCLNHI